MKRAQMFAVDGIMAAAIFLMLLALTVYVHNSILLKVSESFAVTEMERKAELTADSIYKDIVTDAVFSNASTASLFGKTYAEVDEQYGIGFNYSLEIKLLQNKQTYVLGGVALIKGVEPAKPSFQVVAERLGVIGNDSVKLVVGVYS